MSKVIVLGSRPGTGNIGDAIGVRIAEEGWDVKEDDCHNELLDGYISPPWLKDESKDADALVVTVGATSVVPFWEQTPGGIEEVLYGSLILPVQAALEYVKGRGRETGGRIVFIGSYAHRHPFSNGTA